MSQPIICFGQQPCGFFPKRFLAAKIFTARRLQSEIGGEIVFFFHDSDHDPRETKTVLRHRESGQPFELNFSFANRLQRKYSPLYLKRVLPEWQEKTARRLPNLLDERGREAFASTCTSTCTSTCSANIADFCLEMYRRMGLLEGVRVVRSSDPTFRREACDIEDFFVDVPHEGEVVRARFKGDFLQLHEGGDSYISLPMCDFTREQVSPTRDTRLAWMQSVVRCTHYVCGAGEQAYMRKEDAPEIAYVRRDDIERPDEAYTEFCS
jgi:hypothetical protein